MKRQTYHKASQIIYAVFALLLIAAGYYLIRAYTTPMRATPDQQQSLQNVLRLPWPNLIPVTESERNVIAALNMDEPVFTRDIRPWKDIPTRGVFSIKANTRSNRRLRNSLDTAYAAMNRINNENLSRGQIEQIYQTANRELTKVHNNMRRRFIPAYNLGVLHIWYGQPKAAAQFLRRAAKNIENYAEINDPRARSKRSQNERLRVYEAAILTEYALGDALFDDPSSRLQALRHYRRAVQLIGNIARDNAGGSYASVTDGRAFFQLFYSQTNTASLWNDLIGAYLSTPTFHECPSDRPSAQTPCANTDSDCSYRDTILCGSLRNASPPYREPYQALLDSYYGGRFDDEYLLWALSNLVDVNAFNTGLRNNPYLLYNAALIHLRSGFFDLAAQQINDAYNTPATSELSARPNPVYRIAAQPGADLPAQINKLRIIINLIAGNPLSLGSCPRADRTPSAPRAAFLDLYEDKPPFQATGACFNEAQEAEIDKWLFLTRWRDQLEYGEFDSFTQDYDLFSKRNIFPDFFQAWRFEALSLVGQRAHTEYLAALKRGDSPSATAIRDFVLSSNLFDRTITARFGLSVGEWFKRAQPRILAFILFIAALMLILWWHARHATLLKTFRGYHWYTRRRDEERYE